MRYSSPIVLVSFLQFVTAQVYYPRFNFLSPYSQETWGSHLGEPPSLDKPIRNEWNHESPLCVDVYNDYLQVLERKDPTLGSKIYNVSNCILNSTSEIQQQTVSSANLVLGLAPILVSTAGPTLTELALISLNRPMFAVLLSLGTAAVYPTRNLGFQDDTPRQVLNGRGRAATWLHTRLASMETRRRSGVLFVIKMLEYVLVLGAVGNMWYTSWYFGASSISILSVTASYLPLVWVCTPLAVHDIYCGAFHWTAMRLRQRSKGTPSGGTSPARGPFQHKLTKALDRLERCAKLTVRFLPFTSRRHIPAVLVDEPSILIELAHKLGTMLGLVQVSFGVVVLGSTMFVVVGDAVIILLRYLASVAVCSILIAFDIGAMSVQ